MDCSVGGGLVGEGEHRDITSRGNIFGDGDLSGSESSGERELTPRKAN